MRKRIYTDKQKDFKEMKKVIPVDRSPESDEPVEKKEKKDADPVLNGEELFSKFTADIIKEDVFFTR